MFSWISEVLHIGLAGVFGRQGVADDVASLGGGTIGVGNVLSDVGGGFAEDNAGVVVSSLLRLSAHGLQRLLDSNDSAVVGADDAKLCCFGGL